MRLRLQQFDYIPTTKGFRVTQTGKTKTLVEIIRDTQYPEMYRVHTPGGHSGPMNLTRAKDAAFGQAETVLYLGQNKAP